MVHPSKKLKNSPLISPESTVFVSLPAKRVTSQHRHQPIHACLPYYHYLPKYLPVTSFFHSLSKMASAYCMQADSGFDQLWMALFEFFGLGFQFQQLQERVFPGPATSQLRPIPPCMTSLRCIHTSIKVVLGIDVFQWWICTHILLENIFKHLEIIR